MIESLAENWGYPAGLVFGLILWKLLDHMVDGPSSPPPADPEVKIPKWKKGNQIERDRQDLLVLPIRGTSL